MLSDNIRRIRLDHNLSQTAFGNILHVTQSAVSQWEQGITRPDTDVLRAISQAFEIKIDDIMRGEPIPSFREFSVYPVEEPLTPKEEEIMLKYRSLNTEGQEKIEMILDDYARIFKKSDNPAE